MPSSVTPCYQSRQGWGSARTWVGRLPEKNCDNPIASCSVTGVEHKGHDWINRFLVRAPKRGWRHCNGVSSSEKRAAG